MFGCLLSIWLIGSISPAFSQTRTLYATVVDPASDWVREERAIGSPNSNGSDDLFARTDDNTTTEALRASAFDAAAPPDRTAITRVWVNVLVRYNQNTSGNRVRVRVAGLTPSAFIQDSPAWSQGGGDRSFRWAWGGNGLEITHLSAPWTASDVNGFSLAVRRLNTGMPLRVDAFRIIYEYESDWDRDGIVDRLDDDIDGDRVGNAADCDDYDPTVWRNRAYRDFDRDGTGEGSLVELDCYGSTPPAGFSDRCCDGDIDGDRVGNAADCDDYDPTVWRNRAYRDFDRDGTGEGSLVEVDCYGSTPPTGFSDRCCDGDIDDDGVGNEADCDDYDPDVTYAIGAWRDADGDGFTSAFVPGVVCAGVVPAGYRLLPNGDDCDDSDPSVWRDDAWPDFDGDGYTTRRESVPCYGTTPPQNYKSEANGNDCDDNDSSAWTTYAYADPDGDGLTVRSSTWTGQCFGSTPPEGYLLEPSALVDNCPAHFNPDQVSSDGDPFGDACDGPVTISLIGATDTDINSRLIENGWSFGSFSSTAGGDEFADSPLAFAGWGTAASGSGQTDGDIFPTAASVQTNITLSNLRFSARVVGGAFASDGFSCSAFNEVEAYIDIDRPLYYRVMQSGDGASFSLIRLTEAPVGTKTVGPGSYTVSAGGSVGASSSTETDGSSQRDGQVVVQFYIDDPCPQDLDANWTLDLFDILLFLELFEAASTQADFTGDGLTDLFDIFAFFELIRVPCEAG